jgi:arginine-tRNA-protein transferase
MESAFRYLAPPSRCGYLPDRLWRLEYEVVSAMTAAEYEERMAAGWRRFGSALFRPRCPACTACRSLRIPAASFRPNRSQRRVRRANEGLVTHAIGAPAVTREKLDLYDRYHAYQADARGWPVQPPKDADSYFDSFVENPFPTEEWTYRLGERLVGVGFVDRLPSAMSAIYFFYEPELRDHGLGTWNVLCLLEEARARGVPYLYLGYYVEGCASMEYKRRFAPNQLIGVDGQWR